MAFYILYETYHQENVQETPFEAVVYNSLQACAQAHQNIKDNDVMPNSATADSTLVGGIQQPAGTAALLNQSNPSSIGPDAHFRAEYKLLTDFLISVPKIRQDRVD